MHTQTSLRTVTAEPDDGARVCLEGAEAPGSLTQERGNTQGAPGVAGVEARETR